MIKLKKLLIKEAGGPSNVWRAPAGTPDEVIEVLHLIMGEILKRKRNAGDYITLHSYKTKSGPEWKISNKKDNSRGIVWKVNEKNWYSADPNMKAPLSPVILNALIKRWVVDQLGEARIPTYRWETPDGTPDDVVKVYHYLAAKTMQDTRNPKDTISLYHDPDVKDWPFPPEKTWMIVNVHRPSDSILYNAENKTWYSHVDGEHFEPMNSAELKMALQNWGQ